MMDIDLVYLWVDGNDPVWVAKRNACIGRPTDSDANCKGRYIDNGELKYSLRSVACYAPWVRRIFIVTDHQVPAWLDTSHPKIRIVDHTEILPPESLPCFNSVVLEHHLHLIPGLSEHFLFANDDTFINQPVTPDSFFAQDGLPIIRMYPRPFRRISLFYKLNLKHKALGTNMQCIQNAALLVKQRFGKYFGDKSHHNIDAYLLSSYQRTRETFNKEISATLTHHIRSREDIQRILYSYVALVKGEGHLSHVNGHTSMRIQTCRRKQYEDFQRKNPILFCVNDSEKSSDEDRRVASVFLAQRFPEKSEFEK